MTISRRCGWPIYLFDLLLNQIILIGIPIARSKKATIFSTPKTNEHYLHKNEVDTQSIHFHSTILTIVLLLYRKTFIFSHLLLVQYDWICFFDFVIVLQTIRLID